MSAEVLTLIGQYAPGFLFAALLLLLFFPAFERQSKALTDVVRNNTEALTKLGQATAQTGADLEAHDRRASCIESDVKAVVGTTGRTEQKVDKVLDVLQQRDRDRGRG